MRKSLTPLAQINKAEAALASASDIVDILGLRTKAKAIEVVALAEGFGEVAQQAKIFQLKAERKAGYWLKENISPGRPKSSQNARVKLDDLEIDYSQSSRWQLMASIPETKFNGWLDDRLAKGQEITAGGLRNYARNIQGKPVIGTLRGTYSLNPQGCALSGYVIPCSGRMTGGHIINKGKTRGNAEGRAILVEQAKIFMETGKAEIMTWQCDTHNVKRIADEPQAVRIMLLQQIYKFGWAHMKEWFETFLGTYKMRPTELELERLLR